MKISTGMLIKKIKAPIAMSVFSASNEGAKDVAQRQDATLDDKWRHLHGCNISGCRCRSTTFGKTEAA